MNPINKWIFSICFSVVVILAQIIATQWTLISHLKNQIDIINQSKKIEADMVQDLMMQLNNVKNQNLSIGSQQFVAGIAAAIQNPEHYKEIWHAGYNQGVEVQKYVSNAEKEHSYTKNVR